MKHPRLRLLAALPFLAATHAADNLPVPGARVGEPASAAPLPTAPGPIADLAEAQKARAALEELIRAYEAGNIAFIQSRLSPSMIGYQRFLDGLTHDLHLMKQLRVHLLDTQVTAGPDVAVIQTGWEKRYLPVTDMTTPQLLGGRSMFLLHRDKTVWRVAAMAGDNLFASHSGVLGQISLSPALIPGPCPCIPVLTVTLVDPDIAGQGSATVTVVSSQGESETFTPPRPRRAASSTPPSPSTSPAASCPATAWWRVAPAASSSSPSVTWTAAPAATAPPAWWSGSCAPDPESFLARRKPCAHRAVF